MEEILHDQKDGCNTLNGWNPLNNEMNHLSTASTAKPYKNWFPWYFVIFNRSARPGIAHDFVENSQCIDFRENPKEISLVFT